MLAGLDPDKLAIGIARALPNSVLGCFGISQAALAHGVRNESALMFSFFWPNTATGNNSHHGVQASFTFVD
eukprot:855999-Pyramimonas_sp.AAC.1